jgi:hypothetical protein
MYLSFHTSSHFAYRGGQTRHGSFYVIAYIDSAYMRLYLIGHGAVLIGAICHIHASTASRNALICSSEEKKWFPPSTTTTVSLSFSLDPAILSK